MGKAAVFFPGIGYTCDKPLLYYSRKLLRGMGYEDIPVSYSGFPDGVKGNPEKMRQAARTALEQAEEILAETAWEMYDDILFVSKSIGTVIGAAYAQRHRISCRQILFTPVEETFRFPAGNAVAFHGTADPWADTGVIERECRRLGIPLVETEHANHSLETGDIDTDIKTLRKTMKTVRAFVNREPLQNGCRQEE